MIESPNNQIIQQTHTGSGDNVRDKIINNFSAIVPRTIQEAIESIIIDIRNKKTHNARIRIETLLSISNLESDTKTILGLLSVHADLADKGKSNETKGSIASLYQRSSDTTLRDICLSALLKLGIQEGDIETSRKIFLKEPTPGQYTKEIFYTYIANADELIAAFQDAKLIPLEGELSGLATGFYRTGNFKLHKEVAQIYNKEAPSADSLIHLLIADATSINPIISSTQFWLTSYSTKTKIDSIADRTADLIESTRGQDTRLFHIAAPTLTYTSNSHQKLYEICKRYSSEISKIFPEFEAKVASDTDHSKIPLPLQNLYKAKKDSSTRNILAGDLLAKKEPTVEESLIFLEIANIDELKKWINTGIQPKIESILELDFISLLFQAKSISSANNKIETIDLINKTNSFLKKHKENISKISQERLLQLSELLIELNLQSLCVKLLHPILPSADIWLSPLAEAYFYSQITSNQFTSFEKNLSNTPNWKESATCWYFLAIYHESTGSTDKALEAIENSLKISPTTEQFVHFECQLYNTHRPKEELKKKLKNVPKTIYRRPSKISFWLLSLTAIEIGFSAVEEILLNWFLEQPLETSIPLTEFALNHSIAAQGNITPSISIGNFVDCIRYKAENEEYIRIIVNCPTPHSQYFLNINSPLYKALALLTPGGVSTYNMQEIELLEHLPPYIGAVRLALEIRKNNNDGSDVFSSFTAPSNPEELLDFFKKKIFSLSNKSLHQEIAHQNHPLFVKGALQFQGNPFNAACTYYTTEESYKYPLIDMGDKAPKEMILDAYSITYLAISGLAYALRTSGIKPIVTKETKSTANRWIKEITSSNYLRLSLGNDGSLIRSTAEDITRHNSHLIEGITLILELAEIRSPSPIDLPLDALPIINTIDITVSSSITLAYSTHTPWLCLDPTFAQWLLSINSPIVNTLTLIKTLQSKLDIERKSYGIELYALYGTLWPLNFSELLELAESANIRLEHTLYKIIKNHGYQLFSSNNAHLLITLLKHLLNHAIIHGRIRLYLTNQPQYIEHIFNYSISILLNLTKDTTQEKKLAKIINMAHLNTAAQNLRFTFILLIANFANGHFLNIETITQELYNASNTQ